MLNLLLTKTYELTAPQAQALVNLEAQCADFGLQLWLICRPCHQTGDHDNCEGHTEAHPDGTMTFAVKCGCTRRVFRGNLIAPAPPRPLRKPRIDLTMKPEQQITRPQMKIFKDAADVLHQLRMAYGMRCMACREEDRPQDGVTGARESNANYFVLECSCTKRVYRGSDAPLVQ